MSYMANIATFNIALDECELYIVREALRAHRHALRIQREDLLDTSNPQAKNNPGVTDVDEWLHRTSVLINRVGVSE